MLTSGATPQSAKSHSRRTDRRHHQAHIQISRRTVTHSRHKNSDGLYLSLLLSINTMYKQYNEWAAEHSKEPTSIRQYRDTFNNSFNPGFGSLKSDTCGIYDKGDENVDDEHWRQYKMAFDMQRTDKGRMLKRPTKHITSCLTCRRPCHFRSYLPQLPSTCTLSGSIIWNASHQERSTEGLHADLDRRRGRTRQRVSRQCYHGFY